MAVDATGGSTYAKAYEGSDQPTDAKHFKVKIMSPYETYYTGNAVSVSAKNQTGPFDILAGHANFFSLVDGDKVVVDTGFQHLEFPITTGIIRVNHDGLTLFANI
jgi:F0F1-type ATP synthase epsilon subunit